jgi:hypothetical protein
MGATDFSADMQNGQTDRLDRRRTNLNELFDDCSPIEDRQLAAVLSGSRECPQFVMVTSNGHGDYRCGFCSSLGGCGADFVAGLTDDVP